MATRAHSTLVPRRRQPLPTAGKVYAPASLSTPGLGASTCSPIPVTDLFPQTGENLLLPVLPTMGLTDPSFSVSRRADAKLRHQLHDIIERALALLDALDGDPDLEPGTDFEPDDEDCCAAADDDPVPNPARQPHILYGAGDPEDGEAALQPVTLAPDWVQPVRVSYRGAILHAFRAPGEPVLPVTYYPPKPPPNEPPEDKPKRRSSQIENPSLATGLRNACLAGTGFWVLAGLAGWGLA
jgi:hypothetical protein